MKPTVVVLALSLLTSAPTAPQQIDNAEYVGRRARILEELSDGILLLHARSTEKAMEQPSFVQDASFFYFTGLANQPGAVLALDGPAKRAILFVPPPPESFGLSVDSVTLPPGAASASRLGFDAVDPWEALIPYISERIGSGVRTLYVDHSRRPCIYE